MVSRKLYNLCQKQTVTSELARDPSQCPQKVFHKLFEGHHHVSHAHNGVENPESDKESKWEKLDELQKARACGNFGSTETSELFLKVCYANCSLVKYWKKQSNVLMLRFIMTPYVLWKRTPCRGLSLPLYWGALESCP